MDRLKPCPFCGGMPLFLEERKWVARTDRYKDVFLSVCCTKCGCRTSGALVTDVENDDDRKDMAAVAWNRRVRDE